METLGGERAARAEAGALAEEGLAQHALLFVVAVLAGERRAQTERLGLAPGPRELEAAGAHRVRRGLGWGISASGGEEPRPPGAGSQRRERSPRASRAHHAHRSVAGSYTSVVSSELG